MIRDLEYVITGVASRVGRQISMDEWAARMRIPHRKQPGAFLDGDDVTRITGIQSKAWDPELFRDFGTIVRVAEEAMAAARTSPDEVGAVLAVTATPYQTQLDADSFRLLRELRIPDHVPPTQLGAGCCGMARAMTLVSQMQVKNVLVVTYEVSSLYMESEIYRDNPQHPMAQALWLSPAVFSDGAAAVVLRRDENARGAVVYSRDSLRFGDDPGFEDPLIHYSGGGAMHPPGTPMSEELACYAMAGEKTRQYYAKGMALNHRDLLTARPTYGEEVKRIYVHQSSPRMVTDLVDYLVSEHAIPRDKFTTHAEKYGNLVTPSTVKLLHDDLRSGHLKAGDEVCVSVVGAGPERGAYFVTLA